MTPWAWWLGGALLWLFAGNCYRSWRLKRLPVVSDEGFVERFCEQGFEATCEEILVGRSVVAEELGLPARRLSPDQSAASIVAHFEPLIHFHMAWGDLIDDLYLDAAEIGIPWPQDLPLTVGQAIELRIRIRRSETPAIKSP